MSNFFLLMKIRLDQMFEISTTFHQDKWTKKVGMIMHHVIMVLLYAILFYLIYRGADYLRGQGLVEALPIIGYFGAVALTFVATIIKINETFTGNEDSEYLLSMPFSSATQVFVMFIIMYIRNLMFCVLAELPVFLVYRSAVHDGTLSTGAWIWGLLLTSLPICGIAVMIGMVVILSLVRIPKKNQIISGIALFFLLVVLFLAIIMADRIYLVSVGSISYEGETLAAGFVKEISRNFKFGRFYQMGIVEGELGYIMLFSFMSLIWYTVLLFMHTMAYQSVITELRSPVSYGELSREEVVKRMKAHNNFGIILKKELEQFSRSENYMLQCAIGLILGIGLPINFLVMGTSGMTQMTKLIPILLCVCVGISNTTYCSMSMEGKRHWIIEASPLKLSLLTNAKLVLNLMLSIPMVLIGGSIMGIAFELSVGNTIMFILIALVYAVLIAMWGNLIGTRFADYSFESESMIMHRGAPFVLGYLPGIILPVVIGYFIY